MLHRLFKRDINLYSYFTASANLLVSAAEEFNLLINTLEDKGKFALLIADLENEADSVLHTAMGQLRRAFITPMDRRDIHKVISGLDDIIDSINVCAQRITLYNIRSIPDEVRTLAILSLDSVQLVKKAILQLANTKNSAGILLICIEINRLENEADHVLRKGLAALFQTESDMSRLIKLKEIIELLETVTDKCEDLANVIEGLVLDYD